MELIDLVDRTGTVIKKEIDRSQSREHDGLYMQVVLVVIERNGRFLVHERGPQASHSGLLDHVCGAVSHGETWQNAAHRETLEETGVTLDSLHLIEQGINEYGRWRYLVAATTQDDPKVSDHGVVAWARFMHPDETAELPQVDGFHKDLAKATTFLETLR